MRKKCYKTDDVLFECVVQDERGNVNVFKRIIVRIKQNNQWQTISSLVPAEIVKGKFTDGSLAKTIFGFFIKD